MAARNLDLFVDRFTASADGPAEPIPGLAVAGIFLAAIGLLLVPIQIAGILKRPNPDRDYLELGPDGLLYMRAGKSRFWPWRALPAFRPIHSFRQVQFVLPDPVEVAGRRDPWIHEVTPDGPVVAISDIYRTPFDEIAAKLNEYRDRALPGASATTFG
mgnify:CR=1 FL=1